MYANYNSRPPPSNFFKTPQNPPNVEDPSLQKPPSASSWEWYEPPEAAIPVSFCNDTSLHGLPHVAKPGRHLVERVLWLGIFTGAVVAAGLMIAEMWDQYVRMPVVTVFNPTETRIDQIPFPAVTICNVNNVKKSKVEEYHERAIVALATGTMNKDNFDKMRAALVDIETICQASTTFAQRFLEGSSKLVSYFKNLMNGILTGKEGDGDDGYKKYSNPPDRIFKASQQCSEMIQHCVWLDKEVNCSLLFQEVLTDYGYCCTFNAIPFPLLNKALEEKKASILPRELQFWELANLTAENLLVTDATKERKRPRRQLYSGRTAGLSILLDPDLEDYFCTNTDSEGYVVGLNSPLDFPRMRDRGIAVPTDSEVFINVRPGITVSDNSVRKFKLEKRNCYVDGEYELPHYTKYTMSNCIDECVAYYTKMNCSCVRYYMPRTAVDKLCSPIDYNCTDHVRQNMIAEGAGSCWTCLPTCTEIEYDSDVTSLRLQKDSVENLVIRRGEKKLFNKSKKPTIVHIYISVDSTYPMLRKELYTIIDLVSNTGGLLGLCMGFSVISLLEILYYFTVRICAKYYRRRRVRLSGGDEEGGPPLPMMINAWMSSTSKQGVNNNGGVDSSKINFNNSAFHRKKSPNKPQQPPDWHGYYSDIYVK